MSKHRWIRNFFARVTRPIRKVPTRAGLAVELLEDRTVPSTFTVTDTSDNASDTGSLRYAINNLASGTAATTNTINFSLPSSSVIALTNGVLTINQGVTMNGPGASQLSVSGNNGSQVFVIDASVTASISGLTITQGYVNGSGTHYQLRRRS